MCDPNHITVIEQRVCSVCLCSDEKLYNMKVNNIFKNYLQLIAENHKTDEPLSENICWECSARLQSAIHLKNRALRSQRLLQLLVDTKNFNATTPDILLLERQKNNLTSALRRKVYEPNHTDYHFIHTETVLQNVSKTSMSNVEVRIENIKTSNDKCSLDTNFEKRKILNSGYCDEIFNKFHETDQAQVIENHDTELLSIDKTSDSKDEEVTNDYSSSDEVLIETKLKKDKFININPKIDEKIKTKVNKVDKVKVRNKNSRIKIMKVDKRRKPASEVLNTDIFIITDLSHDEQMNDIKKRQNSANYKNSELKCDKCYKGFVDDAAFKGHMNRHSEQGGPYKCNICEIHFRNTRSLGNHMTSHMQKFSCKKCTYVTTRRHAAKLHEEYHNGTKYQCPHCCDEFSQKTTYQSHVRVKHPTHIICDLCGYSFVSVKGLVQHKKIKHSFDEHQVPPDGPECVECNVKFLNNDALERHLRLTPVHADKIKNVKPMKPPRSRLEGEVRKRRQISDINQKKVKRTGPVKCEQCDEELPDSLAYYRHFRRTHPDKNRTKYLSKKSTSMCEICGKMFQSLALLHDHSTTHTDGKQFACSLCDKRFQRKYRLIAHQRLHLQQHRHACTMCGSEFTTTSNLRRHMVTHSAVKPFECEICYKKFKLLSEKRSHINSVHLRLTGPKRTTKVNRRNKQLLNEPQTNSISDTAQSPWLDGAHLKISSAVTLDKPMYYNE